MRCVPIAIFISLLVTSTVQQHGSQVGNCIWEYEDGSRADLNGIGNVNGTARWDNRTTLDVNHDPNLYTINPCHGFTLGTVCQNVTVCRISNLGIPLNIADASSGRMFYSEDDHQVVLEYNHTSSDPDLTYISRFIFECNGNETQVVVMGVSSPTPTHITHRFILLSPCGATIGSPAPSLPPSVTPQPIKTQSPPASISLHPINTLPATNTPPASISLHPINTLTPPVTKAPINPLPGTPSSLTAGGILCIIFICCVCGYFLIGAFYMFCCSGARGVEIIPHIHFWLDLPNLILDGFSFLFGCSCGTTTMVSSPSQDYDKI